MNPKHPAKQDAPPQHPLHSSPQPTQPAKQPNPWADYDRRALDRQIRAGGPDYAH